jgi:hypothetical protein
MTFKGQGVTQITGNNQYYDTYESRLDTLLGPKAQDWARIRRARSEFDKEYEHIPDIDTNDFITWLSGTYGIQLNIQAIPGFNPGLNNEFQIVDDQKYTYFLLKYS